MKQKATVNREQQIISLLKEDPLSIKGLEKRTEWNYYTLRAIVTDLVERNVIKLAFIKDRHRYYTYNGQEAEHDYIPRIVHLSDRTTAKLIYFLASVGNEDKMSAIKSGKNFPRHITKLMDLANKASHGQDIEFMLNHTRDELQRDYLNLKNLVYILEQMLNESRLWNPKSLRDFPNDKDYNFAEVMKAVEYYAALDTLQEQD